MGIFQTCRFQLRLQGSFSALGRVCSESNKTVIMIFRFLGRACSEDKDSDDDFSINLTLIQVKVLSYWDKTNALNYNGSD